MSDDRWKRYVVGPDADGKSAVLSSEASNVQSNPGIFWRSTLWGSDQIPVDNSRTDDRATGMAAREPPRGGFLARHVEIPPDSEDTRRHIAELRKLHAEVKQTHMPTEEDMARHPSMHRTDTLDVITCIIGEIHLITDVDDVVMRPGDTVVIRGTNHAWSNQSDTPCLLSGCMISANPI